MRDGRSGVSGSALRDFRERVIIGEKGGWREASWAAPGSCLVGLVAGDRAEHGLCGAFGGVDVGAERRGVVVARHAGGESLRVWW